MYDAPSGVPWYQDIILIHDLVLGVVNHRKTRWKVRNTSFGALSEARGAPSSMGKPEFRQMYKQDTAQRSTRKRVD